MSLETQKKVFEYLSKNVKENKREYETVHKAVYKEHHLFDAAIVELCVYGLIKMESYPSEKRLIIKRDEFYHAQKLGFELWLKQYEVKVKKEKEKAEWDYKASWVKANTWWIAIAISVISIIVSIVSILL